MIAPLERLRFKRTISAQATPDDLVDLFWDEASQAFVSQAEDGSKTPLGGSSKVAAADIADAGAAFPAFAQAETAAAQRVVTYTISRDEYISLLYSAMNSEVANYADSVGLTVPHAIALQACLKELDKAAILDDLVDLAALRSGMTNSATAPRTLKNLTGVTGGTPTLGADGLVFSGSQWAGWVTSAAVDGFTLMADWQISSGAATGGWLMGMVNSAGRDTGAQYMEYLGSTAYLYGSKEGATETNTAVVNDQGDQNYVCPGSRIPQIAAISYDDAVSPTMKSYVNGVLLATDSAGNTQSTSPLNRVLFGMRHKTGATYEKPFYGKLASWALFGRALTDSEVISATKALRMLEPRRETFIVNGDSISASNATAGSGPESWPYYLITQNSALNETFRLVNPAKSGASTSIQISSFAANTQPWLPDGRFSDSGFHAIMLGTNDCIFSVDSAAAIYARILSIFASARTVSGSRLTRVCLTIPPGASGAYTAPQETRRLAVNTLIRAGVGTDFDTLVDLDTVDVIGSYYSAWWYDGLHPNIYGKRIIAQHVAAALTFNSPIPRNTALPVITGTVAVGQVLTSTTGTWQQSPSSYAYQWTLDGADVSGATTAMRTVLAGDTGKRIACRVTATNATGSAEMTSLQTIAVP